MHMARPLTLGGDGDGIIDTIAKKGGSGESY